MGERYLDRNVRRETREHYVGKWPLSADARRNLYLKYASPAPGYEDEIGQERRDVWQEIANIVLDELGETYDKKGIDVGVSSGYFLEKLLEKGYGGKLLGVDIEAGHMPFLQDFLSTSYPQADVLLGKANAKSLRQMQIKEHEDATARLEKIPANNFDFLTELFVLYHVEETSKALSAAHRVLKPGGLAIFSGRGVINQQHLWTIGTITANNFNVTPPNSFYSVYPINHMERDLEESPKFKIIYKSQQADNLWLPATEDGWLDYREAILSLLPMMKDKKTGRRLSGKKVADYLDNFIRPEIFYRQAEKNNGYFIDYVHQAYFVCEAIK